MGNLQGSLFVGLAILTEIILSSLKESISDFVSSSFAESLSFHSTR